MDDATVAQRLAELETKVDKVLEFTTQLECLFAAFMTGGKGRLVQAAAKLHRERP